jgi:hypothetical protein
MAALAALLASAFAGTSASAAFAKSKKKKVSHAPVITKVSPMDVALGEVLAIKGKYFVRGRKKNSVIFKRAGARAVFIKADTGTTKLLLVKLPTSLQKAFKLKDGSPVATRFQLRVLGKRLGKKFTSKKLSPMVSLPRPPKPVSNPDGDCDNDNIKNSADTDDDNDLLPDTLEQSIGTDPCKLDTDGDGIEDGYEYKSAVDLNDDDYQQPNQTVFYPVKLPYPNPLYGGDGDTDFDGDSLTQREEQALWKYTYNVSHTDARTLTPLSYSDGLQFSKSISASNYDKHNQFLAWLQNSGYRQVLLHNNPVWSSASFATPASSWTSYGIFDANRDGTESAAELTYFDFDPTTGRGYGRLSDNERDEDADGLTNFDEAHSRMTPQYWQGCYDNEKPYYVAYAGTKLDDADTDGDGILDGADDQDHDDVPNIMELSRIDASNPHVNDRDPGVVRDCKVDPSIISGLAGAKQWHATYYGRMNPFNPCLPDTDSRTCALYWNSNTGAPFDDSVNWFATQ